jgi:eukaryotic translation initiation factor 2C
MILCILPSKDAELYRAVKRAGDHVLGIVTQCVVAPTAGITRQAKGRDQYCANISMKINTKLGGSNVSISSSKFTLLSESQPLLFLIGRRSSSSLEV